MGVHDDDDLLDDEEFEEEEEEEFDEDDDDLDEDDDDLDEDDDDFGEDDLDNEDDFEDDFDEDFSSQESATNAVFQSQAVVFGDIVALAETSSPDLVQTIIEFLGQNDPNFIGTAPKDYVNALQLRNQCNHYELRRKSKRERGAALRAIWKKFLGQKPLLPRFQLADFLEALYLRGQSQDRAMLLRLFWSVDNNRAMQAGHTQMRQVKYGYWGALKRIYKHAEARLDAEVWGTLAALFDYLGMTGSGEVSAGTIKYLRRRSWRFLRNLGRRMPALYVHFAVQALRWYPEGVRLGGTMLADKVFQGGARYPDWAFYDKFDAKRLDNRKYNDLWKLSPEPLLLLLEQASNDFMAKYAIVSLRRDHPESLRAVNVEWLQRLATKPLQSLHDFLVETLQAFPEYHPSKLKALGLHDAVLQLLDSPSQKARQYAFDYYRAHAKGTSAEQLSQWLWVARNQDTKKFLVEQLKTVSAKNLGVSLLGRLLSVYELRDWAAKQLNDSFDRAEISEEFLREQLVVQDNARQEWAVSYIKTKYKGDEFRLDFWKEIVVHPRCQDWYTRIPRNAALEALAAKPVSVVGFSWLLDLCTNNSLYNDTRNAAQRMLGKADAIRDEDVERLRGFVFDAQLRGVAIDLFKNTKLIKPSMVGISWLLGLARSADPALHEFAKRYLLENAKIADFGDGNKDAGADRLIALAFGAKEPEPIRLFAQTYLRCHHTVIGPDQPESKELGIRPQISRGTYSAARFWPALFDARPDVRKLAVAVARVELRTWNHHTRIYELCESEAKEVRNLAYDALLKAGDDKADLNCTLLPTEFDAAAIFTMTESRKRSTRQVGMEMIRKHYQLLGGIDKLAWLMQSSDREVRLFAIRILWERHRPSEIPNTWKPKQNVRPVSAGQFADAEALQAFLRRILFSLPPGRSADSGEGSVRRISASVAKRYVIELMRDLALEDAAFAQLVCPLFEESMGSMAKGEWQACLSALVQIQQVHPRVYTIAGL